MTSTGHRVDIEWKRFVRLSFRGAVFTLSRRAGGRMRRIVTLLSLFLLGADVWEAEEVVVVPYGS